MRIGVDARPLREKETSGIPMYVRNVLAHLATDDRDNEYVLYSNRSFDFDLPPHWKKRAGAKTRYGSLWVQAELPFYLKKDRIDVFWGTEHVLPVFLSRRVMTVLTVCDLVHALYPQTMNSLNYFLNKLLLPSSVRRADAIVTISEATLADLKKYFPPRTDLLRPVHLGVSDAFSPRDRSGAQERVEAVYPGLPPYLLTVGTFEPRKNISALVRAYLKIADHIPHHLAIAGQKGWKGDAVREEIERSGKKDRIRLLGYVADELLPDLYAAADLFAFPSLYEGFGLPPLEAMASGVPVLCSNASSLPEVVGDAALLVDPRDTDQIAAGLRRLIDDEAYRNRLVARGLTQAARFRWEKTARQIKEVFDLVGQPSSRTGSRLSPG